MALDVHYASFADAHVLRRIVDTEEMRYGDITDDDLDRMTTDQYTVGLFVLQSQTLCPFLTFFARSPLHRIITESQTNCNSSKTLIQPADDTYQNAHKNVKLHHDPPPIVVYITQSSITYNTMRNRFNSPGSFSSSFVGTFVCPYRHLALA